MTITPSYIPSPNQTGAQAQARAAALGIGLTSAQIPPCYQPAVTKGGGAPGVVAEYGQTNVVYLADNGTITSTDVANLIAPLQAAQQADLTTAANQQTVQANILNRQSQIQAWMTANPSGAVLTAAQTLTLARMLNGLCQLLLQQFSSATFT